MDWYKRDPDKYLAGTQFLTLEERGAYSTLIDLQYARRGDLPDDERIICEYLACRPQTWRRLRASLIEKGKLHVRPCGRLTANGVEATLQRFDAETGGKPTRNLHETPPKPAGNSTFNGRFQKNDVENTGKSALRTRTKNIELRGEGSKNGFEGSKEEGQAGLVHVMQDTPEWAAWQRHLLQTQGKGSPIDKRGGWCFPTRLPPDMLIRETAA